MPRSPLPPLPARRSPRPWPQRCLSPLAKAGLCLLAAQALRQMIEQGAQQRLLEGQAELAADGLRMLWCPALLAAAGALFLLQALLAVATWRPQPRVGPAPPPPLPRRRVRAVDPHRQACVALGLPPGSSWDAIRTHWRRQVIHWHPDRGGNVELWHQRLAAYRLLREREQRREAALG